MERAAAPDPRQPLPHRMRRESRTVARADVLRVPRLTNSSANRLKLGPLTMRQARRGRAGHEGERDGNGDWPARLSWAGDEASQETERAGFPPGVRRRPECRPPQARGLGILRRGAFA